MTDLGLSYIFQKALWAVVHNKFVREACLLEQGPNETVVGDGITDMGIAAKDDRHVVLLAEAQYLEVVLEGRVFFADRVEAAVVDFEQGLSLFRCQDNRLKQEFGCAIAGMRDDLGPGIANGGNHAVGVFLNGAALPAQEMYAGDAKVELSVIVFVEVKRPFGVKDVQLCAKHEVQIAYPPWHDMQVAEIDGVARAGNARSVLRNAEDIEVLLLSGCHHLLQGAVGMAAHNGVGVDVKFYHLSLNIYH